MLAQLRLKRAQPDAARPTLDADSPFVAAKREWNERYGDYVAQAKNWRLAAIFSLTISCILAAGMMWLAGQSKLVPYVVEVDKLGASAPIATAARAAMPDTAIVRAQLANWVSDARTVTSDTTAERATLTRVYSLIGTTVKPYLDDWYNAHSPFVIGTTSTVAVSIDAVLPQSATTYQVQWTETQHDRTGSGSSTTHWEAEIGVGFHPPADEATILRNPMGIYVTQLSWTRHP
jgi:type IV secretion system protein VirB5